jgi:hypothetical protein
MKGAAMAGSRRALGWIVILALVGALLYALNPSIDDFAAWRAAEAQSSAVSKDSKGAARAFEKGAGAIAGAMVGLASGIFERRSFYLFSTFSTGPRGQLYLGIARVFIKLR